MWLKARQLARRLGRAQSGQSLIIIAVASMGLVIVVGLAIDLGLVYTERIRLGRACDAAALAAAQELPNKGNAERRAIEYLEQNGYGPLALVGETSLSSTWTDSRGGTFTITMRSGGVVEGVQLPIDKIEVAGRVDVQLRLMLVANLFGFNFDKVPVLAGATAENVNKLDVVIVYDASASMNDDTYCHTCFNTDLRVNPPPECYGCYIASPDYEYPAGQRMALPLPHEFCAEQEVLDYNGSQILVSEAEWFSNSTSVAGGRNDYHRATYTDINTTFWVLQRVQDSYASGHRFDCDQTRYDCSAYLEDDYRGAHMMHLPWLYEISGHDSTDDAPRLDYQFDIPTAGNWWVWIRAQCGPWPGDADRVDGCTVHWGVDGNRVGSSNSGQFGQTTSSCYVGTETVPCYPPREGGARGNQWKWVRLGSLSADRAGTREVNLWGGGTGFRLDKIVLTTHPEPPGDAVDRAPVFIRETTPEWDEVKADSYQTYWVDENGNGRHDRNEPSGGPPDTGGRKGMACDPCNPIYGARVPEEGESVACDNTQDDMLDDAQPIRAAKEAAKGFLHRMRARVDQVGFVEFKDDATIMRELNCAVRTGMPEGLGVWDPETGPDPAWTWCFDHRTDANGYEGPRDMRQDSGSVIAGIESMSVDADRVWTNTGDGMLKGMEVLSADHNGRTYALKFMILMTDGVPNRYPGNECRRDDLWPYPHDPPDTQIDRAKDCVIYYAQEAKARNIAIFTVGLGRAAKQEEDLLSEIADITGGEYFYAQTAGELEQKLQQIADRIFLRLVD
jgi:hypothetical protein